MSDTETLTVDLGNLAYGKSKSEFELPDFRKRNLIPHTISFDDVEGLMVVVKVAGKVMDEFNPAYFVINNEIDLMPYQRSIYETGSVLLSISNQKGQTSRKQKPNIELRFKIEYAEDFGMIIYQSIIEPSALRTSIRKACDAGMIKRMLVTCASSDIDRLKIESPFESSSGIFPSMIYKKYESGKAKEEDDDEEDDDEEDEEDDEGEKSKDKKKTSLKDTVSIFSIDVSKLNCPQEILRHCHLIALGCDEDDEEFSKLSFSIVVYGFK